MATVRKTFKVGEMKCLDDGSQEQALLIGCPNRTIISLMFDSKKTSHRDIHEIERWFSNKGLLAVEVQTEEPRPRVQR
jgi:hypothetical protein